MALFWTTLAFFSGFAGVSAFGPIVPRLKETMGLDPVLAGLLAACPAFSGSLLRIPFGAMVDRFGGKRPILALLILSMLGIGLTILMFALRPAPGHRDYWLFLLAGVLCGCGIAVFSVGIPTVSYWHPQRKQGTALALYGGLGNLAPGLFAFLLPALVLEAGFVYSYLSWLVLLGIVVLLLLLFMKDAPYFQYRELGVEIDSNALLVACGEELTPSGDVFSSLKKAGSDIRTWTLTVSYFASFGGFIALTVWFPTYWKEYFGLALVKAGLLTAAYALSTSLFRVMGGPITDRLGGEKVVMASFTIVLIGSAVMMIASGSEAAACAGVLILALGMGLANASVFKLVPKFMPAAVGGAAGIVGGLGAFGGFAIPVALGYLVKTFGNGGYPAGFAVFSALSVISLALLVAMLRSGAAGK